MFISRVFAVLAITLCFVACLSAHGSSEGDKQQAEKEVKAATKAIENAFYNAARELYNAEEFKLSMQWRKKMADKHVEEYDDKIQKEKQKPQAGNYESANVQQRKTLVELLTKYPNAMNDTVKAVKSLTDIYLNASLLKGEIDDQISPALSSTNDYAEVEKKASAVKHQAEQLQKNIITVKAEITAVQVILHDMPYLDANYSFLMYKTDGIATAEKIKTVLSEAEKDTENITKNQNKIKAIVESIKQYIKDCSSQSIKEFHEFLKAANSDLKTISQKVNEVNGAYETILTHKKNVEECNTTLHNATNENVARRERVKIQNSVESSEFALERIKKALMLAEDSVQSANQQNKSASEKFLQMNCTLVNEVKKSTKKPNTAVKKRDESTKSKVTERKKEQRVEQTTTKAQKEINNKPEKELVEKPIIEKPKENRNNNSKESEKQVTTNQTGKETERKEEEKKEKLVKPMTAIPNNDDEVQLTNQKNNELKEETVKKQTNKNKDENKNNNLKDSTKEVNTNPTGKAAERETENESEIQTERVTEPPQEDTTVEPTTIISKNTIIETFQNSAPQSTKKPQMETKIQITDNREVRRMARKLHNSTNNTKTFSFVANGMQTSGVFGDGSMIVSVPLLFAIIASVVLH